MKKILLLSAAVCGAFAMSAMDPLSPEQLAKLTVQFNNYADGAFELSAEVGAEYADAANPQVIKINNFNGSGNSLTVVVDWADGSLTVSPQTIDTSFDDDTYMTNYIMIVNEEASKLSNPMDAAFTASRVKGTITEDCITIGDWYAVEVPTYFNSVKVLSPQALTTEVHVSNALMSIQLRDVNWDIEDENWASPVEDTDSLEFGVYVKATAEKLTVYNWDDLASCCEFAIVSNDGVYTCSNNADGIVYTDGKRSYGLYSFYAENSDQLFGIEKKALVSSAITDPKEVDFGPWVVYSEPRDRVRTQGAWAKLVLDEALPLGTTGVAGVAAPVSGAAYYNLQGVRVANPANGVFIKVTTFADGTTKAVKVVK